MKPLPFTPALVREHATEKVFDRGINYAETNAVALLIRRGDVLTAEVYGTEIKPYYVQILLGESSVAEARCTCPYDWGGWCKHIVATLLVVLEDPEAVAERPPLAAALDALDREALVALLTALADERSALTVEIEGRIDPAWQRPPRPEDEWDPEGW